MIGNRGEDRPPHRVVVVGGGFGGLSAARALKRAKAEVTLVDRRNFHLFQPLLYQVATGSLSPGEIATPLRSVLKRQKNARVVMGEVVGFDLDQRKVLLGNQANHADSGELPYDSLVVAAGARHSFFGNDEWELYAPGMKTIEHALRIRRRMLAAFEAAELEEDPAERRAWLNFAVIGAGPTGVELAGQIAEIANNTLKHDFRRINPKEASVYLIEAADRVLPPFAEKLSAKACRSLEKLGVEPMLKTMVTDVDWDGLTVSRDGGEPERMAVRTKIWAAGVQASPLTKALAEESGSEIDRAGRILVEPDLTLPGYRDVFVIGDMARVSDGRGGVQPLPGMAQPAIQEGKYAAAMIRALEHGGRVGKPFRYTDKGTMATIGRRAAVAQVGPVRLRGFLGWITWLVVHLYYLIGFRNRAAVLASWGWDYLRRDRPIRLIVRSSYDPVVASLVPEEPG